jgi:uncharacterized protein with FMN-binding domain
MRRIVIWAMSTLTVLVLLFSYSTSRTSTAVATSETRQMTSSTKQQTTTSGGASGGSDGSSSTGSTDSSGGSGSSGSSSSSGSSGSSGKSSSSGSSSSGSGGGSASTGAKTVDGDPFGTRYGDVQVQITVSSGKITDVTVLQVPWNDRHDQMINSQAVPIYNDEAVQAQSANIDVVSGATVTWEGYTQSLQSAIDKANI